MAQQIVRDRQEPGVPGMLFDTAGDCHLKTRTNSDPQAKKIVTVTVDTASDDTDYSLTVEGQTVTYTSDGTAAKDEIRDGLIAAIQDEPLISGIVDPEAATSDTFTITGIEEGDDFDFSQSDANLSDTLTQASATAATIPFGRAVISDSVVVRDNGQLAKLADASKLTAQEVEITVPYVGSAVYSFSVTVRGDTHEVQVVADTDQDTTVGNIVTALNDQLPANTVVASDDGGGTSSEVILTAEIAGLPFEVDYGVSDEGTSNPDLTLSADNRGKDTDINKALDGLAIWTTENPYPRDGGEGESVVEANSTFTVMDQGRAWVATESEVGSTDDDVYVRLSANGTLDELGGFRPDFNQGCVKLEGASWAFKYDSDLAVVEFD